jgi:hypothetical protein
MSAFKLGFTPDVVLDEINRMDFKIKAIPKGANIKGNVQPKLLTTGQTPGCLHGRRY